MALFSVGVNTRNRASPQELACRSGPSTLCDRAVGPIQGLAHHQAGRYFINVLQSVQSVLRKYADFTTRAARPEFWWFVLFAGIAHLALNSLNIFTDHGTVYLGASLSGAFGFATVVPALAVTVRRLRDAGRSWVELFWLLLPIAGLIVLIVHLSEPSRPQTANPSTPAVEPAPVGVAS